MTNSMNVDLQNCDLIYAVSQTHLNATLATYLANNPISISFVYDFDEKGNLISPQDPADPDIAFQGKLEPVVDPTSGNILVPVVDMSSSKEGTGQVEFQLTFAAGAVFQDRDRQGRRVSFKQGDPTASGGQDAWVVRLTVNLSKAALSELPAPVQQNLDILKGQYGDIFSVQQIFADLSSATLSASVAENNAPAEIGVSYWDDLCQGLIKYLGDEKKANQIPFGFVTTANAAAPSTAAAALVPKDADFIILPNSSQPDRSALVFALVTQDLPLPDQPSLYAEFSGLTLFDDSSIADGYVVASRAVFVDVLQAAMGEVATAASSFLAVTKDSSNDVLFSIQPHQPPGVITPEDPATAPVPGTLLSFGLQATSQVYGGASGNATTDSAFTVSASVSASELTSTLQIQGYFQVSANYTFPQSPHSLADDDPPNSESMPQTTFTWSQPYSLVINNNPSPGNPSTVQFVAGTGNFDAPPVTAEVSGWESFWRAIGGNAVVSSIGDIRTSVASIQSGMAGTLSKAFTGFTGFVMPGNDVFLFSNAGLNSAYNLVAAIEFRAATQRLTGSNPSS